VGRRNPEEDHAPPKKTKKMTMEETIQLESASEASTSASELYLGKRLQISP